MTFSFCFWTENINPLHFSSFPKLKYSLRIRELCVSSCGSIVWEGFNNLLQRRSGNHSTLSLISSGSNLHHSDNAGLVVSHKEVNIKCMLHRDNTHKHVQITRLQRFGFFDSGKLHHTNVQHVPQKAIISKAEEETDFFNYQSLATKTLLWFWVPWKWFDFVQNVVLSCNRFGEYGQ